MKKQMKEKTGSGIVMVLAILMLGSVAEAVFSGIGSGTEQDPYIITNVYQLQEMNDDLTAWYELGNDIDASATSSWNGGAGFEPIGDIDSRFTRTLNGNSQVIHNLYINRSSSSYVGLFGYTGSTATIKNVGLEDVSVTGDRHVSGLVGANREGTISNSYSTGSVNGTYQIAGLVGTNYGGTISNSYSTGSVTGNGYVGGLVAMNYGTVSSCYSTVSVTGGSAYNVGGLVGYNAQGTVSNCYSTGSVTGTCTNVGGLVGKNEEWGSTISNSYSTGSVSGGGYVGGLVGRNEDTVSNSFWDIQTSGRETSDGGTGKTTAEMKQEATFTNWDFINTWDIIEDKTYPFLIENSQFYQWLYAVIVGVGDYIDPNIDPLDYATNDANEIYSRLINSGWIPDHIKLLTDSQATKTNIESAINWMSAHATLNDICLFYFSGYGTYSVNDLPPDAESDGHDEFICPVDTQVGSPESAIRDDELATWMDAILAEKVIMLDACHSGGFINDFERPGYVVLAACEEDKGSAEWPELQHAVFTYYVLEGLDGPADSNKDGKISAEELFSYASPRVFEYMEERSEHQQPQLYDGIDGEVIIVLREKIPADFDGDVDVDFVDYAIFASHWSEQDCNYPAWCTGTDLDYSGSVDINDLAIFTEHWLWPNSGTESGEGSEGPEGPPPPPPDPNIVYSIVDANGNSEITIDVNESITLYIVMETNDVDIFSFNLEVNISDTNLGSIDNTEYPNGTAQILATPRNSFFDNWGPGQEQEEGIEFLAVSLSSPMSDGNMASFVFTCEDQNDVTLTLINHSQGSSPTLEGITIHQGDQMMGGEGMSMPFGIQETQQLQPVQEIDINKLVRFLEEIWLQDDSIGEMISEDEWNEFIDSVKDSPAY